MTKIHFYSIALLVVIDLIFFDLAEMGGHIYYEGNVLENLQAILLFISGLIFLGAVLLNVEGPYWLIFASGALFCLSCLLREIDIENYDIPQFFIFIGSGIGRNILLSGLWLLVIAGFIRRYRHYMKIAYSLINSQLGIFMLTGGILLIVGSLFERQVFEVTLFQFYEELAEMNGYYFILLGSISAFVGLHGITGNSYNTMEVLKIQNLNRLTALKEDGL